MIHYRVIADNKEDWVVFIHPLGGSSATFFKQVREFKKDFNLLLIDLPGHGKSKKGISTLDPNMIVCNILNILDDLNIESAHFVGMCLGNGVIDFIYENNKSRIKSIVYGAAVKEIGFFNKFLLQIGHVFKHLMPHHFLYNLFAIVMMPKKNHKESREVFVKEAKKMDRSDFLHWYNIIMEKKNYYENKKQLVKDSINKLYIYGSEDHLFLSKAKEYVKKDSNAVMQILKDVGHMCHIESPKEFNSSVILFLKGQKELSLSLQN
ncbi:alpha/beta fold hydrolase [Oceanirhabdus sp. W0125-5]|uniref:alpha/beta fold hydrolase n=1 Tax=Oceanirhabdus sp. W0125-5 TaxID=2999116 RepID=UPI0022F3484E|nr:alpha/beta hydrolase [Oceanirhabdus sp. W0125-5]WBW96749.1 alpha/beta hydrolase [Oceanirhabdus sp. W0125-5]